MHQKHFEAASSRRPISVPRKGRKEIVQAARQAGMFWYWYMYERQVMAQHVMSL